VNVSPNRIDAVYAPLPKEDGAVPTLGETVPLLNELSERAARASRQMQDVNRISIVVQGVHIKDDTSTVNDIFFKSANLTPAENHVSDLIYQFNSPIA